MTSQQVVKHPAGTHTDSRIIGESEMAGRIRAFEWASTPLGLIAGWSPELVVMVNLVLSSSLAARLLWSPEFILIYNDPYIDFLGRRHPDALGEPARNVFRESWHVVGPLLQESFATGSTFSYNKLLIPMETPQGSRDIYLDYSYTPVFEDGRVAGLFGLLHDVTDEVMADRSLRENEARAWRALQSIGDAVIVADAQARVVQMNSVAEKLTGWTLIEAAHRPLEQVFRIIDEPTRRPLENSAATTRRTGAPSALRRNSILLKRDGVETAIDDSANPIFDNHGALVGTVLVFRDITEVKRSEAALLKSEKLAAVGRLASSIAHEINNPLESVMNLIFLARQASPDRAKSYLETADQEIRRVSIIANQTLRFHKQASNPQAVSAPDLFATVLSIYEGRLHHANVRVEKTFRSQDPVVCFQGDVRQVLNNLVSNALEAMPFGGRLLVRSRNGRNWKTGRRGLVLTIADSGTGISREDQKRIFEAFFTTKGTAGNGLGLWVSQEIVERHHGALRLRSCQTEGRSGTVFALFLPF